MAQLIVRNLEDDVKRRLKRLADKHGHSTEEEVRSILRNAVTKDLPSEEGLGTAITALFKACGLKNEITELRGHQIQVPDFQ